MGNFVERCPRLVGIYEDCEFIREFSFWFWLLFCSIYFTFRRVCVFCICLTCFALCLPF
ncbi:hypothetical protein ES288_A05G181900v1 [Gossypium darwinii]|uniref:Uncharacterized protein n=2 Tax=Gossypium TaxID=3633 RepID=A0A5D2QG71_GOSTO|nr:hypothetical protein ES288_A05G181900v1 [Gossypium darwinii]TYI27541.1 hypothetical protein ES332_A05G184300v1 [Gossypium tomentosum]TYI27542.1 hypothetical protein ES332_A05G184300v1 [Gossypium tomentosum]